MQELAQEGRTIRNIVDEYFPNHTYGEVYTEIYDAGGRSSLGTKRMISRRIDLLLQASNHGDRSAFADEIRELVLHLYEGHKKNTGKLAQIRAALGE